MCSTPPPAALPPASRSTLHEIGASARGLIAETVTNADGRTDEPLIAGEPLRIGTYELTFHVGGYFRTGFLDAVPIRFGIAEPECRSAFPRSPSPRGHYPRAVARDAVELYDLPGKLTANL